MNKTIHTRDKFSYIATFYKLECLSQYLVHFSTYRVTFQTRPCIFSTKLMIFCLHYSDHWSRPGSPPSPSPLLRHRSLCRSGWFFSPLCFKRKCLPAPSHMCSVHFKWSVMKFLIVWFLMVWFDQNLWLPEHKVAIKYSPNTVKFIQRYYQGRKYTLQSKDSYYLEKNDKLKSTKSQCNYL